MSEAICDSEGEYTEATRFDVVKQLEWNVLESPVFRFKSHEHKFAFQFTLTDTEKMRSVFAERGYILDDPFDVTLNCLKAPPNCRLRAVNICCELLKHEILRFDLNNLPGPHDCPFVKPAAAKFPLSCGKCDRPKKIPPEDVSQPHSYSVKFEILIEDALVVHSENFAFLSPWIELSNTPLRLRAYLVGEYRSDNGIDDVLVCMKLALQLECQWQRKSVWFSICVTGFDRKIQGQLYQLGWGGYGLVSGPPSTSTTHMCMWPVSLPVSPNGTSLKIVVGSCSFKQPILYSIYDMHQMFLAVVSKRDFSSYPSDCSLRTADVIFPVHKAVLGVFPCFKGKLNVDGTEKPTIDLPREMLPESAIELIRYLYYRKVEDLGSVAEDLIKVASELMLDELKQMCANALQSKLAVENVLSLLVIADKIQCVGLKHSATLFLRKHVKEVRSYSVEMWKEFLRNNEGLVAEFF